ncbi:MAG TPA: glycosyltransferase family 4 protein, partial [Gemmatimonadales bacterium]|nr:glycosyltransferase family 4 protein [Gemmatimonadales bacterium]
MTLRVAIVVQRGHGAGAVSSPLHLARGLAADGVHVRFACEPGSDVEPLARAAGLEVHTVTLVPKAHRANARALARLLRAHPVDVVNSQSRRDRGALSLLRLAGGLDAPLVLTWRQMPATFPLKNWVQSRLAERTIAVSRSLGEALVRRGTPRSRLTVIPNALVLDRVDRPVGTDEVARWRERIGWEPSRRTIGIVARPKDQHVVLDALAGVRTPVRLVLAGVDPSSELGRRAALVGAPHVVACVAFDQQVRPLYELLDLVLLPSRIEGTSQALLEAMALGKAIVASRAGGIPDLIEDGVTGRLVPPLDAAAWAAAIEGALADGAGMAR